MAIQFMNAPKVYKELLRLVLLCPEWDSLLNFMKMMWKDQELWDLFWVELLWGFSLDTPWVEFYLTLSVKLFRLLFWSWSLELS